MDVRILRITNTPAELGSGVGTSWDTPRCTNASRCICNMLIRHASNRRLTVSRILLTVSHILIVEIKSVDYGIGPPESASPEWMRVQNSGSTSWHQVNQRYRIAHDQWH
jgi:hypothetical protein